MTTRELAKSQGCKLYTGKPCRYGHCGLRYVSSGMCVDCMRIWNKENHHAKKPGTLRWLRANKDAVHRRYKKAYAKHRIKYLERSKKNYGRRKGAIGSHDLSDIQDILRLQGFKCAYCSAVIKKKYHMDHIIPVSRGGSNMRSNLQATCASCNLSKHANDPIVFARKKGFLI